MCPCTCMYCTCALVTFPSHSLSSHSLSSHSLSSHSLSSHSLSSHSLSSLLPFLLLSSMRSSDLVSKLQELRSGGRNGECIDSIGETLLQWVCTVRRSFEHDCMEWYQQILRICIHVRICTCTCTLYMYMYIVHVYVARP